MFVVLESAVSGNRDYHIKEAVTLTRLSKETIKRLEKEGKIQKQTQTPVKSKYKSQKSEVDGITFASKKEAKRYYELVLLQKLGKIKDLDMQVNFEIYPKIVTNEGVTIRKKVYRADFVYYDLKLDGKVIEDVKGYSTQDFKRKWKQMQERYGNEYLFVIT